MLYKYLNTKHTHLQNCENMLNNYDALLMSFYLYYTSLKHVAVVVKSFRTHTKQTQTHQDWFTLQHNYNFLVNFFKKNASVGAQNAFFLVNAGAVHRQKNRQKKVKFSRMQWKSFKKTLNRYKLVKYKISRANTNTKILTIYKTKSLKKINLKKFKKTTLKIYKTRKRFNFELYKSKYHRWIQHNKNTFQYTKFIKSVNLSSRIKIMLNMITYLNKCNTKRRANNFLKKRLHNKNQTKHKIKKNLHNAISTPNNGNKQQNPFFFKKNLQNTAIRNNAIFGGLCLKTQAINTHVKNVTCMTSIYTVLPNILYSINYYAKQRIINRTSRNTIKKKIYNTLFSTSSDNIYNHNNTPANILIAMPQLLLNNFNPTKKNINTHADVGNTLGTKNHSYDENNTNSLFAKFSKMNHGNTTNYTPLQSFQITSNQLIHVKTRQYYRNINVLVTTKYKTFFIFFVLNFLEKMLHKKIWIRIDSKDPIDALWKNHIQFFLKKYVFLFKKFNKLISVRELLEILWITFKTHDLQILLNFIKKKIENAHFKKHKKILSIFFDVLRKNEYLFKILNVRGFFFDIRGKVGVSGNAKKRHHSFSIGKITTTSQNLGSYFQQINIWTPTGQMGVTCIVQF